MDVKGPFPKRMLKKGAFTVKHFEADPGMSFKLYEDDPVTRKPVGVFTSHGPRPYSASQMGRTIRCAAHSRVSLTCADAGATELAALAAQADSQGAPAEALLA